MAEGGMKTDSDLIGWLIGWLIALALLGALVVPLQHYFGTFSPSGIWAHYVFSDKTPLGSSVETVRETLVWAEAGGKNLLGTQPLGALGKLIGGPVAIDGERWWEVDFENDPDGWVRESDLKLVNALSTLWKAITWFSSVLSLLLIAGIIYSMWRLSDLRKAEAEAQKIPSEEAFGTGNVVNERWQHVQDLVASENPNDWRAAIIEADIMLDELVTRMGYTGESLGDKLKAIEQSDFTSLNDAWEAHKVRNRIAHDGSDFILTQRETRRVIAMFEKVFEEFDII